MVAKGVGGREDHIATPVLEAPRKSVVETRTQTRTGVGVRSLWVAPPLSDSFVHFYRITQLAGKHAEHSAIS